MEEKKVMELFSKEFNRREKIQEEKIRNMIRTEIRNAEKRKEEKEMIKDPSSYHKRYKEIK